MVRAHTDTDLELLDEDLLGALVYADELAVSGRDDAGAVGRVVHAGEVLTVVRVGGGHEVLLTPPAYSADE